MNPFGSVVRSSIPLAFGSDGVPFGPFYGIVGALTHHEPSERLTLRQALMTYTQGAAFARSVEKQVARLHQVNSDLVVSSPLPAEDAFVDERQSINIIATFVDGKLKNDALPEPAVKTSSEERHKPRKEEQDGYNGEGSKARDARWN